MNTAKSACNNLKFPFFRLQTLKKALLFCKNFRKGGGPFNPPPLAKVLVAPLHFSTIGKWKLYFTLNPYTSLQLHLDRQRISNPQTSESPLVATCTKHQINDNYLFFRNRCYRIRGNGPKILGNRSTK